METSGGIPGLRGTEHIGFTVPDLEQAVNFFVEVIGCEAFYKLGPFTAADNWMKEHLNVHPRTIIPQIALLRCKNGANFEIFEYVSADPDALIKQPRNSDLGGHHIAFYVNNMDEAIAYLKSKNVQLNGEPTTMNEGPSAGEKWCYFLTPWGMQLELVSYPEGKAYEEDFSETLYTP